MRRAVAYAGAPWLRTHPLLILFHCGALGLAIASGSAVVARAADHIHAGRPWQDLRLEAPADAPLAASRRSQETHMSPAPPAGGLIELHRAVVGNLSAQPLSDACRPG